MARPRSSVDQKVQGQRDSVESVGKRPYLCGNTGAVMWLSRVPKSRAEYLQLAKELNVSILGRNYLLAQGDLAQVISDLIAVGNGRYQGEYFSRVHALEASSAPQAAPVSQQSPPPVAVLLADNDEKKPNKLSLSRSTSVLFPQPQQLRQLPQQLLQHLQNADSKLPLEDIVDFSRLNDGSPGGFVSDDSDDNLMSGNQSHQSSPPPALTLAVSHSALDDDGRPEGFESADHYDLDEAYLKGFRPM